MMKRALRFQIALNAMVVISAMTVTVAEYAFDPLSSVLSIFLTVIVALTGALSVGRSGRQLPWPVRWFLNGVMVVCGLGMVVVLFFGGDNSPLGRAFSVAHFTLVIISCKFISSYRTRDYAQIFVMSLLLMIVSAMTSGSVILAPFFLTYMVLAGYSLMVYHLQRQVELVVATRFIGITATDHDMRQAHKAVRSYWRQLGHGRFGLSCAMILTSSICLSLVVFVTFPRLETGSLLGSKLTASSFSGFSDQITLGTLDKNQTLRQIVARVTFTRNGETLTDEEGPFYLRGVAFDTYFPVEQEDEDERTYRWGRSWNAYLASRYCDVRSWDDAPGLIKQRIVLSEVKTGYLFGLYPIVGMEGLPEGKYSLSEWDGSVMVYDRIPQGMLDYSAVSLEKVVGAEAFKRFARQLRLQQALLRMPPETDLFMANSVVANLARDMVGSLAEARAKLVGEQQKALREWQGFRSRRQQGPESGWMESLVKTIKGIQDANEMDSYEEAAIQDVYDRSVALAEVDRSIMNAIVGYLQKHYEYSLQPPNFISLETENEDKDEEDVVQPDPVQQFLTKGHAGNCEYFASAGVLLARALGLQARVAGGYLVSEYLPENGYFLVRQCDAHTWIEMYTADGDWERYEATPADANPTRLRKPARWLASWHQLSAYLEKLQYHWLVFACSQDGRRTLHWADNMGGWLQKLNNEETESRPGRVRRAMIRWFTHQENESYFALFTRWMIFFLFLIDLGIGTRELLLWVIPRCIRWQTRRKTLHIYDEPAVAFYPQMLELLQEINLDKSDSLTAREFALKVMKYDEALAPIGQISEAYYRIRFGRMPLDDTGRQFIEDAMTRLKLTVLSIRKTAHRPWPWEDGEN